MNHLSLCISIICYSKGLEKCHIESIVSLYTFYDGSFIHALQFSIYVINVNNRFIIFFKLSNIKIC